MADRSRGPGSRLAGLRWSKKSLGSTAPPPPEPSRRPPGPNQRATLPPQDAAARCVLARTVATGRRPSAPAPQHPLQAHRLSQVAPLQAASAFQAEVILLHQPVAALPGGLFPCVRRI